MAAVTSSSPPPPPPTPEVSTLDQLFLMMNPYFLKSTAIHYTSTPATEEELAALEQICQTLSALHQESQLIISDRVRYLFKMDLEQQPRIDYYWVVKNLVIPYCVANQKLDVIQTLLIFAETFSLQQKKLDLIQDAISAIYENPKFGILNDVTAGATFTQLEKWLPQERRPRVSGRAKVRKADLSAYLKRYGYQPYSPRSRR
jgi:hypothetical protein